MIAIIICFVAFALCYYAGRRSLVLGLTAVLGTGYAYGILRANLAQSAAHFIFDAAVAGLYAVQLGKTFQYAKRTNLRKLAGWVTVLIIWPMILTLVPVQDVLVELVGLRGSIFLIPFLLIGARLTGEERYQLAVHIAWLNLGAFAFAVAEYFLGVERFIPYRQGVTAIIYMSADVAGNTAFRIPATFTGAHAYAGTMIITLPLLVGAWTQRHRVWWYKHLFVAAMVASMLGIFMAATRLNAAILFVLIAVTTISGRLRIAPQLGWLMLLAGIGWVVSGEERLQRFTTLTDPDIVVQRINSGVNEKFADLALKYPMGNGLGGGGTSIPYFLQDRIRNPVGMESEFARIMLEQGLPGLCLWIGFLIWAFARRPNPHASSWELGRLLAWFACAMDFLTGLIGIGLLTSIPQTCLLLLLTGWLTNGQAETNVAWIPAGNRQAVMPDKFIPQPITINYR